MSEWFPINIGLRQGCVMSLWLFNVYMDDVGREVNVRGRVGTAECNWWQFNDNPGVICRLYITSSRLREKVV